MKTTLSYILFLAITILCFGCSNSEIKERAKNHSQYVMDNACRELVYKEFDGKNFHIDRLQEILHEFCERCPDYKKSGGFKNFQYHIFTSSENHIVYTYEYRCASATAEVKFHYALYEDRFELVGFKIEYSTVK